MKTRELTGMSIIEFRAKNQQRLFQDIAKWLGGTDRIDALYLYSDYEGGDDEFAVVVYA